MASGDTLFTLYPEAAVFPSANPATISWVADASTPNIRVPVLLYDGATDEHTDWLVTIPAHYSETTGFTFSAKIAMDGADADLVELEFRALHIDDLDILTGDLGIDTQTAAAIQDTPPATPTDKLSYTGTVALAKANFGSAAPGDLLVIRVTRDVSAATNTDDLQLAEILITET